jgi:hypothetical protein
MKSSANGLLFARGLLAVRFERALLDELANASERAAQAIKEACTATAALTPVNRLPTLTPR